MSLDLHIPVDVSGPADFFIATYTLVGNLEPDVRAASPKPHDTLTQQIREALLENDERDIVDFLLRITGKPHNDELAYIGRVLAIMTCIDYVFYDIHPRAFVGTAPGGIATPLPSWLANLRNRRRVDGFYARYNGKILIPRGPLIRDSRQIDAASADSVADRFAALAVASTEFLQEDRPIQVKVSVIGAAIISGVGPGKVPGAETIGFIPVAEQIADLDKVERFDNGRRFVSFIPAPGFSPVASAVAALTQMGLIGSVDIAIMPEAVMPAALIPELAHEVASLGILAPRLTVCGSGDTDSKNWVGMAWNESAVLNSVGRVLWRQRKIWPAGFSSGRAAQYGIAPDIDGLVMEDNAAAAMVEVVDIDSLGRCIILICQDVLAAPVSIEIISRFQPDWVFTPILDSGIATSGRWINERVHEFSGVSQSRYLVSCSMSFALKLGYPDACCGLAMGPRSASVPDEPGQFIVVKSVNGFAVATWRGGGWSKK